MPFSGASRATVTTATSPGDRPSAARSSSRRGASRSAVSPKRSTSIVFAKIRTRSGAAPSDTTESRASEPVTSTLAAPLTTGGTTVSLTRRRQPGFGPASWLSTSSTYGTCRSAAPGDRRLRCERAPARHDHAVRLRSCEHAEDARCHRIVVAEDVPEPGQRHAVQEDRAVLRLHRPRAAGDGARRVDDGQVDLSAVCHAIEERRPVRRRLGRHERDANHRAPSFHAALRTFSRQRNGARGLRRSCPPRSTWLASWSVYRRLFPPASSRLRAASSP